MQRDCPAIVTRTWYLGHVNETEHAVPHAGVLEESTHHVDSRSYGKIVSRFFRFPVWGNPQYFPRVQNIAERVSIAAISWYTSTPDNPRFSTWFGADFYNVTRRVASPCIFHASRNLMHSRRYTLAPCSIEGRDGFLLPNQLWLDLHRLLH